MPNQERTVELKKERQKPVIILPNGMRIVGDDEFSPQDKIKIRSIALNMQIFYEPEVLLPYLNRKFEKAVLSGELKYS